MEFKDVSCLIGKRELAAMGIVAGAFVVLLVMQLAVWSFVTVAALFIVYASWRTTAFVVDQQHYSGRSLAACIWPVGIAIVQAAIGLALAWGGVWLARLVFRSYFFCSRQLMNRELPPTKQLSEREVESFLNADPQLSQNGTIQWHRTGIWRWESSDGLTFATSDGHTVEKARTARGVAVDDAAKAE